MFIEHRVRDGYYNEKDLGPLKTRRQKGIHNKPGLQYYEESQQMLSILPTYS